MTNQLNDSEIPEALQLKYKLQGHNGLISQVKWSPDGKMLASPSFDGTIKLWDLNAGECFQTLKGHSGRVRSVAWSPDRKMIASASDDKTIRIWHVANGELEERIPMGTGIGLSMSWSLDGNIIACGGRRDDCSILLHDLEAKQEWELEGHSGQVNSLEWSPDGNLLASASHDRTIRIWDKETSKITAILTGHSSDIYSVTWSPDGQILASGSEDSTIRIWNIQTGRTLFIIEGHTGAVDCVQFSFDGKLLASKSSDGTVRLWSCNTWEQLTSIEEPTFKSLPFGLAFHPSEPILASLGDADISIRIWQIDQDMLLQTKQSNLSSQYTNAKVVLVGDSGVGKSGLSLVLTGQSFEPTESTHGRHVWNFDSQEVDLGQGIKEIQEILLWDLAGQPGYRLVHQLHLNELAIVLIVFDARNEIDPFAGVHYWNRALCQAEKIPGNSEKPFKKILVSARADRGRVSVSLDRINSLVRELGFNGYFRTSAKEGWKVEELQKAIRESINWNILPKVKSTEVFEKIKRFLIFEKQEGRLLTKVDDLYSAFLMSESKSSDYKELYDEFETCIGLVESRDLIRRLSFGNLVLLQPELLDAYASAIINAAKEEPQGFGHIVEEDVRAGRFQMPKEERIKDKEQEKLLLIATVEELFSREIALRAETDDGSMLVFPSQFTREWPKAPDPEGKAVIFEFEGAVLNVYTTLVVRLSRSGFFECKEMWKNTVIFTAKVGGECGIRLRHIEEGKAELTLFFKPEASEETRFQFEKYIYTHLQRQTLPQSIHRRRIFVCEQCNTPVSELQAKRRQERGYDWIICGVCDNRVSLLDGEKGLKGIKHKASFIPQMDTAADNERQFQTATSIIQGKIETQDFDVFLAHNSKDKSQIEIIAELLKQWGLNPLLDEKQIPPGLWFQNIIQKANTHVKSAAIFISSNGLGKWQLLELRAFISQCVEDNIPVIPVLLPGVKEIPENLYFLKELNAVFFKKPDDAQALNDLVWGITGERPGRELEYSQGFRTHNTNEFDVFLAHNSKDKSQIEIIADLLKQRGLNPWLDKEQILPGQWFQDVIQQAIPHVKSAAIFISPKGLGRWELVEIRSFISQCVEKNIPVIPVLLPGVKEIPENLDFLKKLNAVFFKKIDDPQALNDLVWGITGEKPGRKLEYLPGLSTYKTGEQAVLLIYQTKDKELVTEIANQLKENGIQAYFDEDILQPDQIFREIASISAVAVCIGDKMSETLEEERFELLINESIRQGRTVIPVILDSCKKDPKLPDFLQTLRSVDFRKSKSEAMHLLIWAITGVRPQNHQVK